MRLADTIEDMLSDNYVDRFRAEYNQLMIRKSILAKTLDALDNEPIYYLSYERDLLERQYDCMREMENIYRQRAVIENIDIDH